MLSKGPAGTVIKTVAGLEPRLFREVKITATAGSGLLPPQEAKTSTEAEVVQLRSQGMIMQEMHGHP